MYFLLIFLIEFNSFTFLKGYNQTLLNSSQLSSGINYKIYENYDQLFENELQSYFPEPKATFSVPNKHFSKNNLKPQGTSQLLQASDIYNSNSGFYELDFQSDSSKDTVYRSGLNHNHKILKRETKNSGSFKPLNSKNILPQSNFGAEIQKNNPWNMDKKPSVQMIKKEQQNENSKPILGGLWSSLKTEPSTFLLVSAIPITILLGAILPTLTKNMKKIGTSATKTSAIGNKAREFFEEGFLSPIFDGISAFRERALENPSCIQRIFCETTKSYSPNTIGSNLLPKLLTKASSFIDESYLRIFGVKTLFDSMVDGNCEKVPCLNLNIF
ncbi:uncharacterized protein TNIN_51231 [Trichonephila inaurata madagascariensis]|uniref:Uncharacterized protein n=1 Tax=Trichonephila inaurata madagascariensis TaxID=2747483 RepID=A0A8X6IMQ0_9ARAC|nr:uncharacterized protein TNIN_51231 [Trichonephila inaurata madagascariensis]